MYTLDLHILRLCCFVHSVLHVSRIGYDMHPVCTCVAKCRLYIHELNGSIHCANICFICSALCTLYVHVVHMCCDVYPICICIAHILRRSSCMYYVCVAMCTMYVHVLRMCRDAPTFPCFTIGVSYLRPATKPTGHTDTFFVNLI